MLSLAPRDLRDRDRCRIGMMRTCLPAALARSVWADRNAWIARVAGLMVAVGVVVAAVGWSAPSARAQGSPPANPARMGEAMGSCLPIQAIRPAANRFDVVLIDVRNDPELIYIPFVDPRAPDLLRWVVDATPPGDGLGQPITLTLQRAEGGDYPRVQHPGDPGLQLVLPSYPAPAFVPTEAAMRTVADVSARATGCFTSLPLT